MSNLTLIENKAQGQSPVGTVPSVTSGTDPNNPTWTVSSVQRLLDVISSIIAEEYIIIAKQNPDIFSNNGGAK